MFLCRFVSFFNEHFRAVDLVLLSRRVNKYFYARNGKRTAVQLSSYGCTWEVCQALKKLISKVALGYLLVRLLRLFRA